MNFNYNYSDRVSSLIPNTEIRMWKAELLRPSSESLQKQKLRLPFGTIFGIRYIADKDKIQGSTIDVAITEGPRKNFFFALFDKDDVDFELIIDNTLSNRDICYSLELQEKTYSFLQRRGTRGILETFKLKGRKFHFVRQGGLEGQTLIATAAMQHQISFSEAAEMVSQMKLKVHYSREKLPGDSVICVETLTKKCIEVKVSLFDTIWELKQRIEEMDGVGIPPFDQRIVFKGKMLEDELTLTDYDVKNGSKVYLILRLTGGGDGKKPEKYFPNKTKETENENSGERGVICFGEKSSQQFTDRSFYPDESVVVEPFVVEMRMASMFKVY